MVAILALAVAGCGRIRIDETQQIPDGATDASPASCASDPCAAGQLCASDLLCHPVVFSDSFDTVADPSWVLMRFDFAVSAGHLQTQPSTRSGFNYGQAGNGRSAMAALHIGDPSWTDYRVEWTQQSETSLLIVDGSLPSCEHTPTVFFRMQSYNESWNAPEDTTLNISLDQGCMGPVGAPGSWSYGTQWQYWIPGSGWSPTHNGDGLTLDTGRDNAITDAPLRFVLEIRGTTTKLWIDGRPIIDRDDATVMFPIGESRPAYGGVAFTSSWEQMFWIDDVVVGKL